MRDFLVDHAIKNVWCTPDQDSQLIIEPTKISSFDGALNTTTIIDGIKGYGKKIILPLQDTRFHLYQIGNIDSSRLGLYKICNLWFTIASACRANKVIIDIYSNSGLQLPRIHTWYMVTTDGNLILAVKIQPTINIDFNKEPIFIRTYSNAYFSSDRSDSLQDFIEVNGRLIKDISDITAIQTRCLILSSLPGAVYTFVNGFKTATVDLISVKNGDVVEYVYDSSIHSVVDIPIKQLPTFISTLDNKNKYLVHHTNGELNTIDYMDDVDFFIIEPDTNGRHVGVYYHKNAIDSVRMVTHRDYSIVVSYLVAYLSTIPKWNDITNLTLRLHIRKSGYNRALVLENNRIEELYKLPDVKLINAMVGVNSTVPNWTAAILETSSYVKLMSSKYSEINKTLVESAYGYNLISKLLANSPMDVMASVSDLPYGLIKNSTIYEYDSSGILLGWYLHQYGIKYHTRNLNCTLIEGISGSGVLMLDEVYSEPYTILNPSIEYRFYICPIINGLPTNNWVDVTDTAAYNVNNGVATWLINQNEYFTLVRSNKSILAYDLTLVADNGLLSFTLVSEQIRFGNKSIWPLSVPLGELDIFLNGYSLIEGIDYIFNFPEVVVINTKYLKNVITEEQIITIRYSGFCDNDLLSDVFVDRGFIEYGLLSHNSKFNIRDDKVLRIVVDGRYYNKNDLIYAEENNGITIANSKNGLPYSIRDVIVPLNGIGTVDTYDAKNKSKVIDNTISNYLTLNIPQPTTVIPNAIESLYPVVSPFCCKIIYDLKAGYIDESFLIDTYNDIDVRNICKQYEYLLKFDPTQQDVLFNSDYVKIQPHNLPYVIDLNIHHYKFIDRVIRLYMPGLIETSEFLSISP